MVLEEQRYLNTLLVLQLCVCYLQIHYVFGKCLNLLTQKAFDNFSSLSKVFCLLYYSIKFHP